MSTEKSGPDESIKTTDNVNNELEEIVSESNDVTEKEEKSDISSHHHSHHHHHHFHHHSYNRSDSGNTYNYEQPSIDSTQEGSIKDESINEVTEIEDAGANSDTGGLSPKKRIPLAAHHRSHRHHSSSGEHHHHSSGEHHRSGRSHHRSRRRSFSKVQYAPVTSNEFRGHVETMGIDEEEFARLQTESLEEMNSKNMDTSNQESVADADRVASEAEPERNG